MTQAVNVCAPDDLSPCASYAKIALELARHLQRLGITVNLFALGGRRCDGQDEEMAGIVAQPVQPADVTVALGYPTNYHRHQVEPAPKIALTMWESSRCPSTWPPALNTMDAVITPSRFCAEVFRECGVTVPIHVIPLGVNRIYKPVIRPSERPLTFLAFLDRGKRKGGLTALHAFQAAFGDDPAGAPRARLVLKGRDRKLHMQLTNPNIQVMQQDLDLAGMYGLYCAADVLIDANRGEGFGLLPREFAATGGLALSTDWAGTSEEIDQWGIPLPHRLVKADWSGIPALAGEDLGLWAEPYLDTLVNWLKYVAESRHYYARIAYLQAEGVRELYRWDTFAERVLGVVEGVTGGDS